MLKENFFIILDTNMSPVYYSKNIGESLKKNIEEALFRLTKKSCYSETLANELQEQILTEADLNFYFQVEKLEDSSWILTFQPNLNKEGSDNKVLLSRDEFSKIIHDIKSPISVVQSYLDIILNKYKSDLEDKMTKYLERSLIQLGNTEKILEKFRDDLFTDKP